MKLSELKENQNAVVAKLDGDNRFISRITSIGLTPGCRLQVVKNDRNRPVLVYSRDTMIALNRSLKRSGKGKNERKSNYCPFGAAEFRQIDTV